jgi:hypothetical protein
MDFVVLKFTTIQIICSIALFYNDDVQKWNNGLDYIYIPILKVMVFHFFLINNAKICFHFIYGLNLHNI